MLWQVNVAEDNCLFEMDPVAKVVTGNKICGPVDHRAARRRLRLRDRHVLRRRQQRRAVYHIDSAGNLIDSAFVGLGMAGLAYNPTTKHLFALTEGANPWDVWVLDPDAGYAVLGGFRVTSGGVPVLQYDALGLEADCAGRLWLNTTDTQIVYASNPARRAGASMTSRG